MPDVSTSTVLSRHDDESWVAFARRVRETQGEAIALLTGADSALLADEVERKDFIGDIAKIRYKMRIATRDRTLATALRKEGITVLTSTRDLRRALPGHAELPQALRLFSPQLWRQQWRSHLQNIGLLSLPKLRIWVLGGLSALLFLFVIFRLLPSADITVMPKQETIDYTSNIVLVLSGAGVQAPTHVRMLELIPFTLTLRSSLEFKDISSEFIGTSARTQMVVTNHKTEEITLKKGTRLVNQAGMVFKTERGINLKASSSGTVMAKAADEDLYGEEIGARGNVPAGLKWDFAGLDPTDRPFIYAVNNTPAKGGTTASRRVLLSKDLQAAQELLKQQLIARARTLIEEKRKLIMAQNPTARIELLTKDDVIKKTFTGVVLPLDLLGKPVDSVTVQGTMIYTAYGYDVNAILNLLKKDSNDHVSEGKHVLPDSFTADRMRVYIIDYDDNFSWIKITADLLGLQEYVLDPLTPIGARFGKKVREVIAGLPVTDAERVIRNMPEVDKVKISVWPPWSNSLPAIPSHISIITKN